MTTENIVNTNLANFLAVYREQLEIAVTQHPEEYLWPVSELQTVFTKMAGAIVRGSYNKDSRALKATCKHFGVKHTYTAINAFIAEVQ